MEQPFTIGNGTLLSDMCGRLVAFVIGNAQSQGNLWGFEKVGYKKAARYFKNADYTYLPVSITYTSLWHYWKSTWK